MCQGHAVMCNTVYSAIGAAPDVAGTSTCVQCSDTSVSLSLEVQQRTSGQQLLVIIL
jgi:hypothetical protein